MLRQQSSRNPRGKGFKVKHFLQISVLAVVCIWLLYQVKHSHDKKKAFEESNSRSSSKLDVGEFDVFRFGRKDLPRIEDTGTVKETHNEEVEHEEAKEVEKESKVEETEDSEGRGAGDDAIDELDREEVGRSEEVDNSEAKEGIPEELDASENQDHDVGLQEAREETFKGDDASSAVSEDTKRPELESEGGGQSHFEEEHSKHMEVIDAENGNVVNATHDVPELIESADVSQSRDPDVVLGETQTMSSDIVMNTTDAEKKEISDVVVSKLENESHSNSTTVESDKNMGPQTNTAVGSIADDEKAVQRGSATADASYSSMETHNATGSMSKEEKMVQTGSATADISDSAMETHSATGSISNNEKEVQTGSATADVSESPMETHNAAPVLDSKTDSNKNDAVNLDSVQDWNITGEMGTGHNSNPENVLIEESSQKPNVTGGFQELNESSSTHPTSNGTEYAAQSESKVSLEGATTADDKEGQLNILTSQTIQNDAQSNRDAASE